MSTPASALPAADQVTPVATPATQEAAPQTTPQSQPAQATPAAGGEQWFLDLGDNRTRYRSREDAVKGIQEAQARILELDPWAKFSGSLKNELGYDVTPEAINEWLTQLNDLLLAARGKQATPVAGAPATQVSPEIAALQAKLQALEQGVVGEQDARTQAAVEQGRSFLAQEAKAAGLPEDAEFVGEMFDAICDAVMKVSRDKDDKLIPGSPEDRYFRGDAGVRQAIIKEHLTRRLQWFDSYAKRGNANYANQKLNAQRSQPRNLPASGGAAPVATTRPSESERMATLRAIVAGEAGQ